MRFKVEEVEVLFPYKYIYPEQFAYMVQLKRSLDNRGHSVLEMSSGTGKTVTILSLLVAYYLHHPGRMDSIIYCSRTVPELTKVVDELKHLLEYYGKEGLHPQITAVAFSARKNLCVNPSVACERGDKAVDFRCYSLTSESAREKSLSDGSLPSCPFFEKSATTPLPRGVYNLEDLRAFGVATNACPYYLVRNVLPKVQMVIFNYCYLLDPRVYSHVANQLSANSVVVIDEAHNIDDVCIESLTVELTRRTLSLAEKNMELIKNQLNEIRRVDASLLREEYDRLVSNLKTRGGGIVNPLVPAEVLNESVPGNMRRAEHFLQFLSRFVNYLRFRMESDFVVRETIAHFQRDLRRTALIDAKPLGFCLSRMSSMIDTLRLGDVESLQPILKISRLATLLVHESPEGFAVVIEPSDQANPEENKLTLCCLDATLVTNPIFGRFRSILLTSGTLVPMEIYPRLLNFPAGVQHSLGMTQTRANVCPMIVTRGSDQITLSTKFESRDDIDIIRNYGLLLAELCSVVPDGIACFFTSYAYMEKVVMVWQEQGFIDKILRFKLIFIETVNALETKHALSSYRKACDNGRGGVLLSVARGKVSEGIDFENHYGRAVIMYGVPYVYTQSRILAARLEYLRDHYNIMESEFLTFDAMRHTAQCVGRVLRGKTDYGVIILADFRFGREDKKSKLPNWILENLSESFSDMSIDEAVQSAKHFLKMMSVPVKLEDQLGTCLLTRDDILLESVQRETLLKMGVDL